MHVSQNHAAGHALPGLSPLPPRWIDQLLGPSARRSSEAQAPDQCEVSVATGDRFTHVSVTIPAAAHLPPDVLAARVRSAYLLVADTLTEQRRHPIRFWNFVPGIHMPTGDGSDRYMVFNAGRFAACEHWHGSQRAFDHTLAAASGVGVQGHALGIHCLAADAPGRPVENPRQVPAYRYSTRYGPRPPCFARATRVANPIDGAWWLLVAGTASIRGEDTVYPDDVQAQTRETLQNLDALLEAARDAHRTDHPSSHVGPAEASLPAHTRDFSSLRVYVVRPEHAAPVRRLISDHYQVDDVEYAQAELCRTDLLVEIEGVAEL
jgi:chorismate lyase / 3-hydroxybenzoate synthase